MGRLTLGQYAPTGIAGAIVALLLVVIAAAHARRSVWLDEAWLVEFARQPTLPAALAAALDQQQPVAPGYLAAQHLAARLGPGTAWGYRLTTTLLALPVVLGAAWLIARAGRSGLLGLALVLPLLACPLVQRYFTEIKQYLPEAGFTLLLIVLADRWAQTRRPGVAAAWLAVAVLAILGAFAGWFAVAGSWLVALAAVPFRSGPAPRARRGPARVGQLVVAAAAAAVVLGTAIPLYRHYIRPIARAGHIHDYWARSYLPLDGSLPAGAWNALARLLAEAWYLYPAVPGHLMLALLAAGWALWLWRQPWAGLGGLATVALTLGASVAQRWPLGVRVNLALVVLLQVGALAGTAAGLRWLADRRAALARRGPPLILAGALVLACWVARETLRTDYAVADVRPALDHAAQLAGPGDGVILDRAAGVNQLLEPRRFAGPTRALPLADPLRFADDLAPAWAAPAPEVTWIVVGHHNQQLQAGWDRLARQLPPGSVLERVWSGRLAAIYRYTGAPPTPSPRGNGP